MSLMGLYERLPLPLQNVAISLYGMKLKWQRYGREFKRYKEWLYKTESLPLQELKAIQEQEFIKFYRYSLSIGFYRSHYKYIDPNSIRGLDDLAKLPPISKDQFRTNLDNCKALPFSSGIHVHTGGTTGTPIEVVFQRGDFQKRQAMLTYYREKWGFYNGMRRATFSGRTIVRDSDRIFWRHNYSLNQRLYSTFHLKDQYLRGYVDDLVRFRPEMIDGFPSAINYVAQFMKDHKVRLSPAPKVVFTTSETLYDDQRETIEQAFGCKVANQYASAEGAPFVVECPRGSLHYDLRSGIIEVEKGGTILVTSFTTHGTPLIRYEIGDRIEFFETEKQCGCGNNNPLVRSIQGRNQDYLVSRDRGFVAVGLVDIFKKTPSVFRMSQIVQRKLDKVELYLVAENETSARGYLDVLEKEIKKRMGESITVEFKFVSEIEPEKSGKYRFIKNLMSPDIIKC
jgi:phenylacetate-CoA ligase